MSPFSKVFSVVLAFLAMTSASPIQSCPPPSPPTDYEKMVAQCSNLPVEPAAVLLPITSDGSQEVHPVFYEIFPETPDLFKTPVSGLHLETYNTKSQVEQAIVFKNIPANAKNCSLQVAIADKPDRFFMTKLREASTQNGEGESHLVNVHRLTGFPLDGKVSYNSVQAFPSDGPHLGGLELGGWDISEQNGKIINKYGLPCAGEFYFKLAYRQRCNEKSVYLHQDSKNGVFLRYDL
ncbi:hypothetical protein HJFPF1_04278 [Paramyrothecium foliicola]|nr:hypothetical protein HJFPF1_04278 [Paramyrothecium foliicola]